MTRDYAKNRTRSSKKQSSYFWLWLVFLFLFAAFTFGLVYFGKNKPKVMSDADVSIGKKVEEKKIEKSTPPVTTFDFYTMLPQKKHSRVTAEEYELEIATVKDYAAADRLKAELALLGFAASIAPSRSKNGMPAYNISIGSYDNKDSATADLARLKQNKIYGKLKKIR